MLRGRSTVTEPRRLVESLQSDVEQFKALRLPLYLNEKRIADNFELWLTPIKELLSTSELGAEVSGSALHLFKVGTSKRVSDSATIELTPMLKLRLLEETAREKRRLVNLATEEPREGALLWFVGDGVFESMQLRDDANLGLSGESAQALEKERERWQAIQKASGKPQGTMVWVPSGPRPFASIFGFESVNWSWVDSHGRPPFGILGLPGENLGSILLVTALFIWHEMKASEESGGSPSTTPGRQ
jgi:hypothetical protein